MYVCPKPQINRLAIGTHFGSRSPAKDLRDKNAGPNFNAPRLLTGSSIRILKYFEVLEPGPSTEIGIKDFFGMASKILLVEE